MAAEHSIFELTDFSGWNLDPDTLAEADARFLKAAQRQIDYETRAEREYGDMFSGGQEYARNARRAAPWLVKDFLPLGYLAILGASSKSGKSAFVTALAMSVATGDPFLGRAVTPGAVLWCAFEETEEERLSILEQWPEIPGRFFVTHRRPYIDDEAGLAALRYWVYRTDAKLIVIDPLFGATQAETLTDGRAARRALIGLKDLCKEKRCAALVLHHITKDVHSGMIRERFAESHQILATASMDILMDFTEMEGGGRLLRLASRGRGDFANKTLLVRSSGVTDYRLVEDPAVAQRLGRPVDAQILLHLRETGRPQTAQTIAEALQLSPHSTRNRLTALQCLGKIQPEGKEDRATLYALKESPKIPA